MVDLSLSLSLQWGPQLGRGWPPGPRRLLTHPSSQHQVRAPLPGPRRPRRLSKDLPLPFAPGPAPSRAPATWTPSAAAAHCRWLAPVVGQGMAPVLTLMSGQARARGVPTSLPASLEKTQQLPLFLRWGRGVGRPGSDSQLGVLFPFPVCVSINKTHVVSVDETVAAQSHTPAWLLPSLSRGLSCLVLVWVPTPEGIGR